MFERRNRSTADNKGGEGRAAAGAAEALQRLDGSQVKRTSDFSLPSPASYPAAVHAHLHTDIPGSTTCTYS